MKKTVTINLSGCVYTIDEDAYHNLQEYLESLKLHLSNEEGCEEILADIEARIAELFNERMKFGGLQVMTLKEVDEIISTLGRPEDFEIEPEAQPRMEQKEEKTEAPKTRRRLYRNTKDKALAGVCSGLADYFGIDVVAVRLIFVAMFFLGGSAMILYLIMWIVVPRATESELTGVMAENCKRFYRDMDRKLLGGVCSGMAVYFGWEVSLIRLVLVLLMFAGGWFYPLVSFTFLTYIAAWIVIPPAVSAAQKLEMRGENPNIENIKRFVQDAADRGGSMVENGIHAIREKNFFEKVFSFFGEVFTAIFKLVFGVAGGCLGCLGAIIVIPVIFALVVALLSLIVHPLSWNIDWMNFDPQMFDLRAIINDSSNMAMIILSAVLIAGIPLLTGIYALSSYLFKLPRISRTMGWVLFGLWIAGVILTGVFGYIILKGVTMPVPVI